MLFHSASTIFDIDGCLYLYKKKRNVNIPSFCIFASDVERRLNDIKTKREGGILKQVKHYRKKSNSYMYLQSKISKTVGEIESMMDKLGFLVFKTV
jgi:hypothetical protein